MARPKKKELPPSITYGESAVDPKKFITISGARVHNLKNVSVSIPRNQLTVITGLSGSGKSSLAFDTLFAEGQRRYVESLSSYARQFLGRLDKPDVDSISGISPAVAIEQKVTSRTSRSTVGTSTEIYDYMKLLFARIGKTISPVSGREVKRHTAQDVLDFVESQPADERFLLLSPIELKNADDGTKKLKVLAQQGFSRIMLNTDVMKIEEAAILEISPDKKLSIVIDRFTAEMNDENRSRILDSAATAFFEGHGVCVLKNPESGREYSFSNKFELDGITFEEPSVNLFAFNNPVGACKTCEGFGSVIGIDEKLVIPDKRLSIYQDAVACWKGYSMSEWKEELVFNAARFHFPIHKSVSDLTGEQRALLWTGNKYFRGLNKFFKYLESESYKIQYRVMLSRYRGKTKCPECGGTRLRSDAGYVKVGGRSITELAGASIGECLNFFRGLRLNKHDAHVAQRLLLEITNRLGYLCNVGLEYLTLNRLSNTLSGGESQRINLATCLGSALVGSMYILDEPSIGLHPRDTLRLIEVLKSLKQQGNTVIVVEHDEEIMRSADYIIDMGPEAGTQGGHVTFSGSVHELEKSGTTLTARYLRDELNAAAASRRKISKDHIVVRGAREHSLKNIDVEIPLRCFTAISGVSGSGKSTLVKRILYPALQNALGGFPVEQKGDYDSLEGDVRTISAVEFVDQNPIGKSSRSNPVTFVKAFDDIRNLFASQTAAKHRGYAPGHFSFNVPGGRCEACEGEGHQTITMQFMADIKLLCDVCKGKRYMEEILEITYRGKNINDVLNLTVDEAIDFFSAEREKSINRSITEKILPLQQVGMGYIGLGQSSSSLSGGEAQRVKLATFLAKGSGSNHTFFIFDEPTTGLHFHDVKKLMESFRALIERGHTIVAIEHNTDVILSADWLIDLGPEGGEGGGRVIYTGIPANIVHHENSHTGKFLAQKLAATSVA